jgi:serine/threonine-protein kinase RsbT
MSEVGVDAEPDRPRVYPVEVASCEISIRIQAATAKLSIRRLMTLHIKMDMPLHSDIAEIAIPVKSDLDILNAIRYVKELSNTLNFSNSEQAIIAIVISEIARNIKLYAKSGTMQLRVIQQGHRCGILVVAQDQGPGIADLGLAMQNGYTTSNGLGIGLPGAKRLMDEFDIVSEVGKGTTITMKKWESARQCRRRAP